MTAIRRKLLPAVGRLARRSRRPELCSPEPRAGLRRLMLLPEEVDFPAEELLLRELRQVQVRVPQRLAGPG